MALPQLALNDPGFWQNPFPVLNELRERTRVAETESGMKVLLRHADVGELLLHRGFANEGISFLERRGFRPGDMLYEYRKLALGALSGDDHRRFRTLVGKALSSQHVELVRPMLERQFAREWLPRLDTEFDAVELAQTTTLGVISEFLGIDAADRQRVDALVREGQAKAFGINVTEDIRRRANILFTELWQFIAGLIEARRLAPQNDALTRLLGAEEDNQTLSHDEVIVLFLNLFIGAVESTAAAIATGVKLLGEQPALLAAIRAQPERVGAFVEENLRLHPPNMLIANKIALEDTEFCGVRLARGETLAVPIPAPNRDPRAFAGPDRADLGRPPQRHFTFSLGAHFCLGQAMARAQLQQFFSLLSQRTVAIELQREPVEWEPFVAINSMRGLRVRPLSAA